MTYGRFTLEQWEKRNGNPYLEADGRWHRITDFHVMEGLGIVTYQAEECDPREVERWLREHLQPVAEIPGPQIGAVETTEGARAAAQYAAAQRSESTAEVAQQKDDEDEAGAAVPANPLPVGDDEGAEANSVVGGMSLNLLAGSPSEASVISKPKLATFARTKGWKVGRISNEIKQQYEEEYPD